MSWTLIRPWLRLFSILLGTLSLCGSAMAALRVAGAGDYGLGGTIGPYPIAMVVSVRDHGDSIFAHYSYASKAKRIPLRVEENGSAVKMTEPSGGVFDLHLMTTDSSAAKPLTFYTSTGLAGIWTNRTERWPVKLTMIVADHGGGDPIKDCTLYPNPPPPKGPHFPNPGCEHTPDRATLDECIAEPFVTDAATIECINKAMQPCRDDQYDDDFCVGNVEDYLDQILRLRVQSGNYKWLAQMSKYKKWRGNSNATCIETSFFLPEGSGYGADISFCMAAEDLRLLQMGLKMSSSPIRTKELH